MMIETGKHVTLSSQGTEAILLDCAGPSFDEDIQQRVWAAASALLAVPGVRETVPGMNNLMVVFDPFTLPPAIVEQAILTVWHSATVGSSAGQFTDVPVVYGGADGGDLDALAAYAGLSVDAVIAMHSGATYCVAAVGAMPGFVYLSGLPPALAMPRRREPRMAVKVGSVIIGGSQAGIMPCTAPSGWHALGLTALPLFDATRTPPATFRPGDRIRFTIAGVEA